MRDWTGYSAEELDRQYDNRGAVANHADIFASWSERSRATRRNLDARLDCRYGPDERQVLDLFLPEALPAPLHLFLHGGYWQAMNKDAFSFMADPMVKNGCAVAVASYRLCPSVRVGDIVADVRAACRWLWRHAAAFGVDATRLQLSGHSAGGHLVGMLWATRRQQIDPTLPEDWLHSAVSMSGLFELAPLVPTRVNVALGLDAAEAAELSPSLLPPRSRAPLLLAVGEVESAEYHRQSQALAAAWRARGTPLELIEVEAANHFTIVDELAREGGVLAEAAQRLWRERP